MIMPMPHASPYCNEPPRVLFRARQRGPQVGPDPTHEAIARRAYEIYLMTGRQPGQCAQNWQQARQSLRDQTAREDQQRAFDDYGSQLLDVR
jgi:hypothetical protein